MGTRHVIPQVFAGIFTSNPALVIFTKKALRVYMAVMFMFEFRFPARWHLTLWKSNFSLLLLLL